jgi:uncharacterized protein (TIGR03083 family)
VIYPRPLPGRTLPGQLLLSTEGAGTFDPGRLLEVFVEQRLRFAAVLRCFGPGDWAAPTRCAEWSAHDVVRHLCDGTMKLAAAGPGDRTLDLSAGFDPRISPRGWPAVSAIESPADTLRRFLATTSEFLAAGRDRLNRRHSFGVSLPYGPMDWTVLMLHGFWDSWIHERDILLAAGREHPTDGDATVYATAYGLFIAAAVASMSGCPVREKLALSGDGGGVFGLGTDGGGVTLAVTRVATAGPPAAEVADALAGRAPAAGLLGDLPAGSRAALSRLGQYFNTPVGQSQAVRSA